MSWDGGGGGWVGPGVGRGGAQGVAGGEAGAGHAGRPRAARGGDGLHAVAHGNVTRIGVQAARGLVRRRRAGGAGVCERLSRGDGP